MRWVLLILVMLLPCSTFANMVITEVMCNPAGSDADREWVKIKNIGTETVDITGWKFNDGSSHTLNIPPVNGGMGDMHIDGGESALLANKASEVSGSDTIIDTVMSLSNSGDTLKLVDVNGVEVHVITYDGDDVVEEGSCFTYDSDATTTTGDDVEIQKNIITTVNEVTRYRTVEIQPPQDIYIREIPSITALVGSIVGIHTEVYDARGGIVKAVCNISFGDGESDDKCDLSHTYEFAGSYILAITARKSGLQDSIRVPVRVVHPNFQVRIGEGNEYIEIINNADTDAELSGWLIKMKRKKFAIPSNTIVTSEGSIKISAKTMDTDIVKYGSIVLLVDALGTVVADSSESVEIAESEAEVVVAGDIAEEDEEQADSLAIEVSTQDSPLVPVVSGQRASLTTRGIHSEVSSDGIIGTYIGSVESTVLQDADKKIKEDSIVHNKSKNTQQLAVVSANVPGESWNISDVLPQESSKWFVGLLALLGIATVPVFMSKGGEVQEESDDTIEGGGDTSSTVASFTIEEVK